MNNRILISGSLKKHHAENHIIYHENALLVMRRILDKYPNGCFDMIFADPPYFLSNGGFTCQNGQMVSVNKGDWDKSQGMAADMAFYEEWLGCATRYSNPTAAFGYAARITISI